MNPVRAANTTPAGRPRLDGFNERISAVCARMTTGAADTHLREMTSTSRRT